MERVRMDLENSAIGLENIPIVETVPIDPSPFTVILDDEFSVPITTRMSALQAMKTIEIKVQAYAASRLVRFLSSTVFARRIKMTRKQIHDTTPTVLHATSGITFLVNTC